MTTTHDTQVALATTAPSTSWPRVVRTATAAGTLLFLAGQAALPVLPNSIEDAFPGMVAHRDQLMASRLLTSIGCFLLVLTGVALATMLARRVGRSRTVRVGGALVAVGMFFNAVAQAVQGYATYVATGAGVDAESGQVVVQDIVAGPVGFPLSFASVPLFAIGFVVVAIGLYVSRAVPVWLPTLLLVGTVMAGALAGRGPVVALTQAPVTIALIALAALMTRPRATADA
ncbi:hypothetical protein [Calidifontibacter indicus]|uniref:DUF4386 family protein n=1 Tax=Calidifontibacter indicus TaxID=419650 RepID=A0A3D9UKQ3_9MICO|nr:hypothetical protein [Calidifontibacter indicus]REF30042.1 hypothetical protein DFJ65_1035 [Calidifontibacter indicus]